MPAEIAAEMGIAIAAVTAYIDQPTVDRIFDCGMIAAIQKPIKSCFMDKFIKKHYKFGKIARLKFKHSMKKLPWYREELFVWNLTKFIKNIN